MRQVIRNRAARILAMVAICLQAVLPGVVPQAHAKDADFLRILCELPGQELSAEAMAAASLLAELLGEEGPEPVPTGHSCSLCTLVQSAVLPMPPVSPEPLPAIGQAHPLPLALNLVHVAEGPPVGSRGPPSHL